MFFGVNVESLVFDDVLVLQTFHDEKVWFQVREMFVLEGKCFDSKFFSTLSFNAFPNDSIGSFSKFFTKFVFLIKKFVLLNKHLFWTTIRRFRESWVEWGCFKRSYWWWRFSDKINILMKKRNILKWLPDSVHMSLPVKLGVSCFWSCDDRFCRHLFQLIYTIDS